MEGMITILKSEYESLHQPVEYLQQQVRDLQTELSLQKHGRDSSTGSTSPSQDTGRSNSHSLRKSNGKKSGRQAGHEGHHLSMSASPEA
jgi:hypothetical protein